jgi:hypothetical protein
MLLMAIASRGMPAAAKANAKAKGQGKGGCEEGL